MTWFLLYTYEFPSVPINLSWFAVIKAEQYQTYFFLTVLRTFFNHFAYIGLIDAMKMRIKIG